jgi:hypothetical protein
VRRAAPGRWHRRGARGVVGGGDPRRVVRRGGHGGGRRQLRRHGHLGVRERAGRRRGGGVVGRRRRHACGAGAGAPDVLRRPRAHLPLERHRPRPPARVVDHHPRHCYYLVRSSRSLSLDQCINQWSSGVLYI